MINSECFCAMQLQVDLPYLLDALDEYKSALSQPGGGKPTAPRVARIPPPSKQYPLGPSLWMRPGSSFSFLVYKGRPRQPLRLPIDGDWGVFYGQVACVIDIYIRALCDGFLQNYVLGVILG